MKFFTMERWRNRLKDFCEKNTQTPFLKGIKRKKSVNLICVYKKKEISMIILKKCVILHLLSGSLTKGWLLFNPISKYILKNLSNCRLHFFHCEKSALSLNLRVNRVFQVQQKTEIEDFCTCTTYSDSNYCKIWRKWWEAFYFVCPVLSPFNKIWLNWLSIGARIFWRFV